MDRRSIRGWWPLAAAAPLPPPPLSQPQLPLHSCGGGPHIQLLAAPEAEVEAEAEAEAEAAAAAVCGSMEALPPWRSQGNRPTHHFFQSSEIEMT